MVSFDNPIWSWTIWTACAAACCTPLLLSLWAAPNARCRRSRPFLWHMAYELRTTEWFWNLNLSFRCASGSLLRLAGPMLDGDSMKSKMSSIIHNSFVCFDLGRKLLTAMTSFSCWMTTDNWIGARSNCHKSKNDSTIQDSFDIWFIDSGYHDPLENPNHGDLELMRSLLMKTKKKKKNPNRTKTQAKQSQNTK